MGRGVPAVVELLADAVSVGLLVTTRQGHPVWANQALRDLVGSGVDPATAGLPLASPASEGADSERPWTAPDGSQRWLEVKCRRLPAIGGDDELLLHEIADITRRHEQQERAWQRLRRLSRVEALAKVGTWEWDLATDEVMWSDELLDVFGYPRGTELDYHEYRSLVHPEDMALIEGTLAQALETGERFSYTHRMYLADRVTMRIFECYGEVLHDDSGRPVRVMGTAHDITEQRRRQEELAYLAEHDALTSLPNRRSIVVHLRERLDLDGRYGAVLLVDIDHFKDIIDLLGYAVGDQVLQDFAPLLVQWSDRRALLGRLGGDEFALVLPDGDGDHALAVARSLCQAVARHTFPADVTTIRLTVSVGAAPLTSAKDPDGLLSNAAVALHEAKRAGRNRAELFAGG